MKKTTSIVFTLLLATLTALADTYQTAGNGTTWTLTKLSEVAESGVTKADNTFTMTESVEIVSGDRFEIESGVKVMMGDKVQLRISCDADFTADERVLFTSTDTEAKPYGIYLSNDNSATAFKNIDFEYAGIKCFGAYGADITDCTFRYHNAVSGTAALSLGANGAQFSVTGCTFEKSARCAIAGAANFNNPVTITDCVFEGNGTDNRNYPQINLTAAENVVIRNCQVTGNPAHNMVGGICVSNLLELTGDLNTLIEDCDIRENRYGLALYCAQNAKVLNNTIVNNNHETNPMNGGSGINLYDPQKTQTTVITGNYIENNLWGITVIGGKNINIGKVEDKEAADYNPGLNVFLNNGFNGTPYDLYNNSPNTVYAQGNFWKSVTIQDEEHIETVVFHKNDDPKLGEVIFMPALPSEPTGIEDIYAEDIKGIEVYDLNGTLVAKSKDSGLQGLRPGTYIIRTTTANGVKAHKVIR